MNKVAPLTVRARTKFIGAVEDEWQLYSDSPSAYSMSLPIGFGASSIVYAASYHPPANTHRRNPSNPQAPIECALKVIDLDALPLKSLQLLKRETQLMSLSKHPNVLRVRGTWMTGHKLFIAMRLMKSGSVADVMRYGFPDGLEEEVCRCVLKQALEGLNYLHINGFIHRDLKAANLLIDEDGTVLLGDLGVAVSLADEDTPSSKGAGLGDSDRSPSRSRAPNRTSHQRGKRRSFVGTPCWMAPEVVSQKHYDAKADIWSFGITALELTLGRAPRSRDPPHKVLMKTYVFGEFTTSQLTFDRLNEEPPAIDREGGPHKYSKAFEEMVARCLVKDPAQRPTAHQLLQSPFFKGPIKKNCLVSTILKNLPPLVTRQERKHHAVASAVSSVASWDFDSTPCSSVPTTPKHRKISNLFLDPITSDQDDFQLQDEVLFESSEPITATSNRPIPPLVPGTDAKSEPSSEQAETESSGSSSLPSTPPSRTLETHILTTTPSPPGNPEAGTLSRKQTGMWRKLTGSKKAADGTSPPQVTSPTEKASSRMTRTLSVGARLLNNR